ncbi:MAG TPA: hypothetical protein HPP94_07475 [Desulfuromonadales bacterium]|nr:hypothetical protein [Desulfuromonadales bacterium]
MRRDFDSVMAELCGNCAQGFLVTFPCSLQLCEPLLRKIPSQAVAAVVELRRSMCSGF